MPYQEYWASHSLRHLHCNARTICQANRLPSKSGAHRPATERSMAPVLTHGVSMPGSVGDDVNAHSVFTCMSCELPLLFLGCVAPPKGNSGENFSLVGNYNRPKKKLLGIRFMRRGGDIARS